MNFRSRATQTDESTTKITLNSIRTSRFSDDLSRSERVERKYSCVEYIFAGSNDFEANEGDNAPKIIQRRSNCRVDRWPNRSMQITRNDRVLKRWSSINRRTRSSSSRAHLKRLPWHVRETGRLIKLSAHELLYINYYPNN